MNRIDFDDMEYAAPLRQFDLRTAPERMAVVEHRLSLLEAVEVTL